MLGLIVVLPLALLQSVRLADSVITYTASQPGEVWQGRAPVASLELSLDPDNVQSARLRVVVEAAQFNSGNIIRDANARRAVFQTHRYPEIIFEASQLSTEGNRIADGVTQPVTVRGELTMHGVTRALETTVTVTRSGQTFVTEGSFSVLLSDFGMRRPTFFNRVVDDAVTIALRIVTTLA
jgi:polyisoprenoid-binding protein YceI